MVKRQFPAATQLKTDDRELKTGLEGLIPQAMLELADRSIVGHASGLARGFDCHVAGDPVVPRHLEHVGLPATVVGLGDNPEPAVADPHFARHQ
jgi:hypothetical protein